MIIGFGNDLCSIHRIEKLLTKFGDRFLQRCFTAHEQNYADVADMNVRAARLAKRFAAKEACAKALGTGIGTAARLTEIEVRNSDKGMPEILQSGSALTTLGTLLPMRARAKLWLSLSDENGFAMAHVIIESVPE